MCVRGSWRGVTVCLHMVNDLDAIAYEVGPGIDLQPFLNPASGSYQTATSASIGTHAGGGAIDFDMSKYSDTDARHVETVCRNYGLKLAYFRHPITGLWEKHVHVTFPNCPDLSSAARSQYPVFAAGEDNLTDNAPDTGDRTHVAQIMAVFHDPALYKPLEANMPLSDADAAKVAAAILNHDEPWGEGTILNSIGMAAYRSSQVNDKVNTLTTDVESIKSDIAAIKAALAPKA